MFDTVLVANRGEIAVRVIRTLRSMGIRSVAVYSEADAGARHAREADVAVPIGPAPAAQSYLSIERVLDAAARTGAQAVHPGYGFLSENVEFARACEKAGVVFIGPPVAAIEAMGDKIRAKQTVMAAGVPVVPGRTEPGMTDEQVADAAVAVGFPVLLKPSAGGGGKGMRVVRSKEELPDAIAGARREALAAFGSDVLLVERRIAPARHVEIQFLADAHGNAVHLGERECSLQRRHQKLVEECPSPVVSDQMRARMGEAAVALAGAAGYASAGTCEFLVPVEDAERFYFLEVNARLQVEHPVTELVYGLDLVEAQLRIAAGERLWLSQGALVPRGHAIEARVCAEDAEHGFLPRAGRIAAYREPAGPGIRVDSGVEVGSEVTTHYDSLLAKVIAHAPTRAQALDSLDHALAELSILGPQTNTAFLRRLLADDAVRAAQLDTGLAERLPPAGADRRDDEDAAIAAVLALTLEAAPAAGADPWE
ncbi:MAG TPA: biotin carboxylase N-terminal domain-containing protein, partial [Solirubrobacteraceae bacterium]|nr:biotin carboxylase N-terminal domain-containing protein [Solirubrobacteraceae bacterium]